MNDLYEMTVSTRTVLCIDDDEDDRQLVCEAINLIDPTIRVIHTDSGIKALAILKELEDKKEPPCLVILDVNMPMMDGRETLEEIRKLDEKIPVVLFTTGVSATTNELHQLVGKHHAQLEGKPNSMKEIISKIQKMLSHCP